MSYVAANTAAILSHVPGGLGVIEAVVLSLVPGANVVGALIAFRVVYYLIPFVIGSVLFAACEILRRHPRCWLQTIPVSTKRRSMSQNSWVAVNSGTWP
jgi:hypothetical protein